MKKYELDDSCTIYVLRQVYNIVMSYETQGPYSLIYTIDVKNVFWIFYFFDKKRII